jgi:hypothetical protein
MPRQQLTLSSEGKPVPPTSNTSIPLPRPGRAFDTEENNTFRIPNVDNTSSATYTRYRIQPNQNINTTPVSSSNQIVPVPMTLQNIQSNIYFQGTLQIQNTQTAISTTTPRPSQHTQRIPVSLPITPQPIPYTPPTQQNAQTLPHIQRQPLPLPMTPQPRPYMPLGPS